MNDLVKLLQVGQRVTDRTKLCIKNNPKLLAKATTIEYTDKGAKIYTFAVTVGRVKTLVKTQN